MSETSMRVAARIALSGLILALGSLRLSAQPAGALTGRVTDESGAPLPGVTVEARGPSLAPAGSHVTATDRSGAYTFFRLPAGLYEASFRIPNFASLSRRGIAVSDGATARVDVALPLAATADVVVTAKTTLPNLADIADAGDSLIGVAASAAQGTVSGRQIDARPILRPGDVLETVPGLLISQHSGEGKANQYYLRGFNLDHGTDFATSVAGMPVNMPSHAHGQGYSDLNFLIPELVSGVQYEKGPYAADQGDFSSAGSASIRYANSLEIASYWSPLPSLVFDAAAAFSRARFADLDPAGDHIPGAVETVVSAGVSVEDLSGFFGSLRVRYFGPRPLIEDNSVRSKASTLLNKQIGYGVGRDVRLAVDVFNVLNSRVSDVDYFYRSRLPGEPASGVDDIHAHPVEPRSARLSVLYSF